MPRYRAADRDYRSGGMMMLAAGAVAGFTAGMIIAERFGGFSALASSVRGALSRIGGGGDLDLEDEYDSLEDELEDYELDGVPEGTALRRELEERVLAAFNNDPILCERAIDISALNGTTVELSGWVRTDDESRHAVTIARGVPGVETVVNRILAGDEEVELQETIRRYEEGDDSLREARWEGQRVGTGRRRQRKDGEDDRHEDPKPVLEERWLRGDEAIRERADDIPLEGGPRPRRDARVGRADGSPLAPGDVPKGDHVAEPDATN